MIQILQKKIEELYRLAGCPEAKKYILSPKQFKKLSDATDEPQVLYMDEGSDATLGIYLGSDIFHRIKKNQKIFSFKDFCVMAEEISHFIYIVWSKSNDKKINLLDLELQAEVDKYVLATNFFKSKGEVFEKIFESFRMRKNLRKDEEERYYTAHRLGKKLASNLQKTKISSIQKINWLRMFYRQSITSRILLIEKGLH